MIIIAYSNGQKLTIGDEFIHDGRKWIITHFDLDKKDRLKYFYALDEEMTEVATFDSYDENIIHLTGKNYKELYNIKKAYLEGEDET